MTGSPVGLEQLLAALTRTGNKQTFRCRPSGACCEGKRCDQRFKGQRR